MRLAIVAVPPLALVSITTLGLALAPHLHMPPSPPTNPDADKSPPHGCYAVAAALPPAPTCETAHTLIVIGHIDGGASHVKLAGPILYTDVATNFFGDFELRVPVDGNVCDLLTQPTHYVFGEDVSYTITFE